MKEFEKNLSALRLRVMKSLETEDIPYSFKGALSSALAGLTHLMLGHIEQTSTESMPDSSEGIFLDRWASVFGLVRKPAEFAVMKLKIDVETGFLAPKRFRACDFDFEAGVKKDEFLAVKPGFLGIRPTEARVAVVTPGVKSFATVSDFLDGSEAESDEALRARLLKTIATPPQGGSDCDFIGWVLSVPGVRAAWLKPASLSGKIGIVEIFFLEEGMTRTALCEKRVLEFLATVAPAHAIVKIAPLKKKAVSLKFTLENESEERRKMAIDRLKSLFLNEAVPCGFLDFNRKKQSGIIHISRIHQVLAPFSPYVLQFPTEDLKPMEGEILAYEP